MLFACFCTGTFINYIILKPGLLSLHRLFPNQFQLLRKTLAHRCDAVDHLPEGGVAHLLPVHGLLGSRCFPHHNIDLLVYI